MEGLKTAIRYSIKPHQLGLCGPQKGNTAQILLDFLSGKDAPEKKVREILEQFEGSYAYYKLIAKSNNIGDPFDEQVVRAYWIGNELLNNVPVKELRKMIQERFKMPEKAKLIPGWAKPHHSFHVMMIGSVTGRIKFNDRLRKLCVISWRKNGDDFISYHWGKPCEVLNQEAVEDLKKYTVT